jgi:hypothetical protein
MMRVLLVKAGKQDNPVTKEVDIEESRVAKAIAGHELKFLGATLRHIGKATHMSDFSGPDHVVLDASAGSNLPGVDQRGYYLVVGLPPSASGL